MRVNDKTVENYDHLEIIKRASQETSLFLIEKVPSNLNDKICLVSAYENSQLPEETSDANAVNKKDVKSIAAALRKPRKQYLGKKRGFLSVEE